MVILFGAPMIDYSGAPKIMVWLANSFLNDGHEVHIVTYNSPISNEHLNKSVIRKCLGINAENGWIKRNTVNLVRSVTGFIKYARKIHAECVITFTDNVSISVLLFKRLIKSKFFISERLDPYTNTGKMDCLRRRLFPLADGIVFQTNEARDYFPERIKRISIVIPNPVIMERKYTKSLEREDVIVSLGRLDITQKRQDILIESIKLLLPKYPNIKVHIYGSGKDEDKIREMISDYGLESCVFLKGVAVDVYKEIKDARVFAFTSDFEGIPNALIEAMSMGVPVVTTDCSPGGARLLVKNKINGLIVSRGDAKALSRAILYMLNNKTESERMADEAMKIVDEYSEASIITKWKEFIGTNIVND